MVEFIKQQVESGIISLHKIASKDNFADILTKPTSGISSEKKQSAIMGQTVQVNDFADATNVINKIMSSYKETMSLSENIQKLQSSQMPNK